MEIVFPQFSGILFVPDIKYRHLRLGGAKKLREVDFHPREVNIYVKFSRT
jgi:hypothetical protein